MVARDARSLSPDALEALRRRAVAAVQGGASQIEVARLFGVSRKTVGAWVAAYQRQGEESFRPKRRGRRPGEQMALSPAQQALIVRTIVDGPPDRLGLPHRLWTGQAIAGFVRREFGIGLSPATISKYLERWGLIDERRRMDQRRSAPMMPVPRRGMREVGGNEWLPDAEILWLAWTRPHAAHPRGPVVGRQNLMSGFRDYFGDVNVLVATSNRGVVFLLARRGPFDAKQATEFLERLMAQVGRALNVIVFEWPVQYHRLVRPWPQRYPDQVSVRFTVT
jgi:transposase